MSSKQFDTPIITNAVKADLIELSNMGTIIINSDLNIIYANDKAYEIFDYVPTELIGKPLNYLLPERLRDKHTQHMNSFIDHPKKRVMGEANAETSDIKLEIIGLTRKDTEKKLQINLSGKYYPDLGRVGMATITEID